ncbi:MAG TPA: hypothetical protein V6C50_05590 [Crinalium sp.]
MTTAISNRESHLAVFPRCDGVEQISSDGIDRYNCGEHFLFPLRLQDIRDFVDFLALARHWGDRQELAKSKSLSC